MTVTARADKLICPSWPYNMPTMPSGSVNGLQGDVLDRQLAYWRQQLAAAPVLELPTDRPRPAVATHRGANLGFSISPDLTQRLRALSRREAVTLFTTLLAAFQIVLGRHAGQDDVVIGTSVANRNRIETEGLIGFLVNQLVLRTDLSGNPTFRELLRRARETTLDAYANQDVPFEKLVEELAPQRGLSRSPFFQVKLVFLNAQPKSSGPLLGLEMEPFFDGAMEAKFGLLLLVTETENRLAGTFSYSPGDFSRAYVEMLAAELQELLSIVTVQLDLPLASLKEKLDEFAQHYRQARMADLKKVFETTLSRRWQTRPNAAHIRVDGEASEKDQ